MMGRHRKYTTDAERKAEQRRRQAQDRLSQMPVVQGEGYTLYQGGCFAVLPALQSHSVDLILADLPCGTTACSWDVPLPLGRLWHAYARVMKPHAAVGVCSECVR